MRSEVEAGESHLLGDLGMLSPGGMAEDLWERCYLTPNRPSPLRPMITRTRVVALQLETTIPSLPCK